MPRGRNKNITKEYRQERWDKCMKYLRENEHMPAAVEAAHADGFSFDASVWVTALSKMLERGERPGCAMVKTIPLFPQASFCSIEGSHSGTMSTRTEDGQIFNVEVDPPAGVEVTPGVMQPLVQAALQALIAQVEKHLRDLDESKMVSKESRGQA